MTNRKGSISVNTQDIFPIIKKWLYSEHDIFVRELVSNACDAITKRNLLAKNAGAGEVAGRVKVVVNEDEKTLTFEDNGLGMTEAEVEKYIAQLAFSGAEEFVNKMKESGSDVKSDIIGKFGLGFFSVFMVADKVEVESLSWQQDATPTKWISNGDTEYEFASSTKSTVGTSIKLFINDESKDFLQTWKTRQTLTQYCDFMPYPIELVDPKEIARIEAENAKAAKEEDKKPIPVDVINETQPLWKKDPTTLTDEDYKSFYRRLFPMESEPLFWIHLNVDHPFLLQGVLFFPKLNPNKPVTEQNIKLYSKQVFVSDNVKNIIPEFLGLLKGVIDSTDIPLNVSRSALQGDPNVKKIANYIIKKVAESLKKLAKNERERYDQVWSDIGLFVKYGVISDTKFDELMRDKVLFQNTDGKMITLEEYRAFVPEKFQEKLKNKVVYFETGSSDLGIRKQLQQNGIPVVTTDTYIDPHFISHTEMKKQGDLELKFTLVDNALEDVLESEAVSADDMTMKDLFQELLGVAKVESKEDQSSKGDELTIEVKKFSSGAQVAYFKVDESMKRFQQMTKSMGNSQFTMPMKRTLVINPGHNLVKNVSKLWAKTETKDLARKLAQHVQDLATLSGEGLKDEDKQQFVSRSQDLIGELSNLAL